MGAIVTKMRIFCVILAYNKIKMKKLLLIFLITSIYLNRSYAYFYDFLGKQNLAPPIHETEITFGYKTGGNNINYVALGDSLTEGVGVSDYRNSYPYLIAQKMSTKFNVKLINLSHAGDTSKEVLTNQLPKILFQKPDLITILIGVNDIHNLKSLKEFEDNYTQIITSLKKTGAKLYVLSIPYLGSDKIVYFPYNLILELRTKQFNNVIKKVSITVGAEYIDLNALSKSANFYSSDQFHPGEEGYKEWAKTVNVN